MTLHSKNVVYLVKMGESIEITSKKIKNIFGNHIGSDGIKNIIMRQLYMFNSIK